MIELERFSDPDLSRHSLEAVLEAAEKFKAANGRSPVFMEVCGSHTMALAKTGIKARLKDHVRLIAGPGCPVCVTDQKSIDAMIALSKGPDRILCTFGDMMRVPGSKFTLMKAKTEGEDIRVVYSPLDSVKMAEENPEKEVIFLGIGFETTIPILALAIREAEKKNLQNFSIWMTTKLVEPVLRTLLDAGEVKLDGFLLPGHVAIVSGKRSFDFLSKEYNMPGVISGFEPVQLLSGMYKLLQLLLEKKVDILNDYTYLVKDEGNLVAQKMLDDYLEPYDEVWRGMSTIPGSGLVLKEKYASFDAKKKFNVSVGEPRKTKCRCGEIIKGTITPEECMLFAKGCTPTHPIGPCMVSTEGTCAAHYQYMRED
ncbi:hydrogenase formation protein HypD [Halobacillus andaensis]|uniref:Hydrogenase formation protein HypD n=1 Tax=Halobacillus andaensis TaxID=1176239 RepID=A0A917B356_HALAA|nr:hydrogenase formation protein HypD [Halobacillus andaensis]MBP2004823.1 hydrogenase expression/formation protein HypD [Halobacillus andaensis]GGF18621.1 hydrogenase formation protein HypD [Halobacillus andaensis]